MKTRPFRLSGCWYVGIAVCAVIATPPIAIVALLFGFFNPVQSFVATRNVAALERQLRVGESRAAIEAQFGHAIPRPERLTGYAVPAAEAVEGWGQHLGEYAYTNGASLCFTEYTGIVVYYDAHDRAKFWKHFKSADGC